jgi:RimK-like ATP-grasp domain.
LEILDIKAYKGRNIYSHHRVVKMIIDLKDWDDVPTCEIPKFNQSLAELLPGLHEHYCSLGYPGGFIKRLEEGTYLAHVIEHTALEILNELGYNVTFGKARRIKESSQYTVVYAYENEYAGLEAGKLAVDLIRSLCNQQPYDLKTAINEIKEKAAKLELGPSTQAIVDAALERGIPVMRIGRGSIIQLGYGKYQKRLEATITDKTSCIAVDIACDKSTTKEILIEAGIPVPNGSSCSSPQEAVLLAQEIGYPVVVKPERGNQGRGVSLNLLTSEEVIKAYNIASKIDENVIVERYVKGNDYRVLVVGDQVVAVSQRIPAHVVGDGVHSIRELVEAVNADPRRGNDHEKAPYKNSN